jgi:hypothetical protein
MEECGCSFLETRPSIPSDCCRSGEGRQITYSEVRQGSDEFSRYLEAYGKKTLGFVLCRNTPACLMAYLGALRSGQAVCLLDADLPSELLSNLLESYVPDWVFAPEPREISGYDQSEAHKGYLYRRSAVGIEIPMHQNWLFCYRRLAPQEAPSL